MAENRISANLAPADKEAVMQAIATIREKLPFLVDLTPEDRRKILKMGDKSRAFVNIEPQKVNVELKSRLYHFTQTLIHIDFS
ncbi:MAG: hypothetical protein ACYTXA_21560 [Nostoc sp.]